jgi:hypothetical protein
MKRNLLYFSFLFLNKILFSQEPPVVLAMPEQNFLYRGYDHHVTTGTLDGDTNYRVEIEGGSYQENVLGPHILTPSVDNFGFLRVIFLDKSTSDTLNTLCYKVVSLPPPNIYFGGKEDGEKILRSTEMINLKYGPHIALNWSYNVISWVIIANGREFHGSGNLLNSEAKKFLAGLESGKWLTLEVSYKGPDNLVRKRSARYSVL